MAVLLFFAVSLPVLADNDNVREFQNAQLFRDGSISCSGADDLTHPGGRVIGLAQPGVVFLNVHLRHATPNATYTLAVSQEPNCANPKFFPGALHTNADGAANAFVSYNATTGVHNLLVNTVTDTPDIAINREIGTTNFRIRVPRAP
jgi:hypothetical protein